LYGQKTVTRASPRILVSGDTTPTLDDPVDGTVSATPNLQITRTTDKNELTSMFGDSSRTMTATWTSSGSPVLNTAACNNYPEFCSRKYSNITEVCAQMLLLR
jgi:hypothetical protein